MNLIVLPAIPLDFHQHLGNYIIYSSS